MKNVWIVIVNYNSSQHIAECLLTVDKLDKDNFLLHTVIIDNNSNRESLEQLNQIKKDYPETKLILNKKNLGFSGGNNVGIKFALEKGADHVLLLNSDTYVHKDLIVELLKSFQLEEKIGITVPKIYFAKGFEFHKERYNGNDLGKVIWYAGGKIDWDNIIGYHIGVDEVDNGQYDQTKETEIATGCCMLIKKEVFEKVGLLDEKYFLYYEDSDFSIRVKKSGFKIFYTPKGIVWHKNAGSTGGSGSNLQDYYITRNRLFFAGRYRNSKLRLPLIKESLKLLFIGRKWQKKGIIDYYLAKLGKGTYPID